MLSGSEASTWARPPAWLPRILRCAQNDMPTMIGLDVLRLNQQPPQYLANDVFGQFGAKFDLPGNFVGVETLAAEGEQFVGGGLFAAFEDDDSFDKGRSSF